jgi:hypothetical protein
LLASYRFDVSGLPEKVVTIYLLMGLGSKLEHEEKEDDDPSE